MSLLRSCTLLTLICCLAAVAGADEAAKPRLVVQITVDQLRGDTMTRFGDRFVEGGFRHFLDNGTHFNNAHQPYLAPGAPNKIFLNDEKYKADKRQVKVHKEPRLPLTAAVNLS